MDENQVLTEILEYLRCGNPILAELKEIPLDDSLVELGYMDSYGVVDIVVFLEGKYSIIISDEDITKEKFGSVNKMVSMVLQKNSN